MVSEQYDSSDRNLVGDVASLENNQVTNLDAFLRGIGPEISPLPMLKRLSKIMSFTHSNRILQKRFMKNGERECEFCDEQLDETELLIRNYSHKAFSMLYLHEGMKDELMVIVYHKMTKRQKCRG